jgi:hypothetical protein
MVEAAAKMPPKPIYFRSPEAVRANVAPLTDKDQHYNAVD